ncbi:paraquat-inducible protein A [Pseudomonas sp. ADAK18]|uniref:paraquat-inducible protein A n=1 Tax=Pseudomonas sp. ADAK18 TaxID=2730848 RepID=UPI001463C57B|nr:paraquat-inducible protein A [Pseudomonas sp. ADAK18]QJI30331.1 paraquat-inducible protein A [Pseudomonas sp. ADAK18]
MTKTSWTICEHCDAVYPSIFLEQGQKTYCLRCGTVLEVVGRLNIQQMLALSVCALIVFCVANAFPVMSISVQGLSNEATLWQSINALAQGHISVIAAVAGLTIILAPLLQIILLCWVLSFAVAGVAAPGFSVCMRALEYLRPWSMLEVCLLGILVAIIKLGGLLDVHPGLGLWALAMLTLLIIPISGKSIRRLWGEFEGGLP